MRSLLTALFFVPTLAQAQSWCPPGAQWHWSMLGFATSGYVHEAYVGDTMIAGREAQRIHRDGYVILHWANEDTIPIDEDVFTSQGNGDVFLWMDHEGTWAWDTLFRFHAVPGDTWAPAGSYWSAGACVATVMDTATIQVDGMSLRHLWISMHDAEFEPSEWTFTLTERLGFATGNWSMPHLCMTDADIHTLLCYADADITYAPSGWSENCQIGTGVGEHRDRQQAPHPNPGTTHFTLDLPPGPHTIELFDATGRRVHQQQAALDRTVIDTQALPPGMYHVRVLNGNGVGTHHKWIKE